MRRTLVLLVFLAACNGATPTPTGATCPSDNTLTYDNFGAPFMKTYCTRCHASTLTGDARHGAPLFHDFDTLVGIIEVWEHVDEQAAAGPLAINRLMPFSGVAPTDAERYQLGSWLACEVAAFNAPDAGVPDAGAPAD
jgi:uncharacterized membrane protein